MGLDKELSEHLLGCKKAKIVVDRDNNVEVDGVRLEFNGKWFNFHFRIMELAALNPGSTYELEYKLYPPCHYSSEKGFGDLLDYIIPESDRFGPMLESSGINLYFCKSNMEKFKIFKGTYSNDYGHDKKLRDGINEAFYETYEYRTRTQTMDIQDVFHSRKTYFGAAISGPYSVQSTNMKLLTIPGIALIGELKDKEEFKDDLSFWIMKNYKAFEDWKTQWE